MVEENLETKSETNQTAMFGSVSDIVKELAVLNPDIIRASMATITNDKGKDVITLAGQQIKLKFSKNGYLYGMLVKHYISGNARTALLNYLRADAEYVAKLGKYEIEKRVWNNTELYFAVEISTNKVAFIMNENKYNEMISTMEIRNKREDIEYSPKVLGNESVNEIHTVGITPESMFGSLYDSQVLDGLEKLSEYIEMADSNEPDIKQKLEEILEQLKEKLGE